MHEPSEKVLKTIVRKDWKIGSGYVHRNVTLLVTPRVVVNMSLYIFVLILDTLIIFLI